MLEVRVLSQHVIDRAASSQLSNDCRHGDTHAPDARKAAHYLGVDGDPTSHARNVPDEGYRFGGIWRARWAITVVRWIPKSFARVAIVRPERRAAPGGSAVAVVDSSR